MDGALWQTFLESSRGAHGAVHSHYGCSLYEPRGKPLCEALGNANF